MTWLQRTSNIIVVLYQTMTPNGFHALTVSLPGGEILYLRLSHNVAYTKLDNNDRKWFTPCFYCRTEFETLTKVILRHDHVAYILGTLALQTLSL